MARPRAWRGRGTSEHDRTTGEPAEGRWLGVFSWGDPGSLGAWPSPALLEVCAIRKLTGADDFSDVLERTIALLAVLETDFAAIALPDAQKLEQSLSGLERMLSDAIRSVASAEQTHAIEREVKEQLKPYRKQMEPAVYKQTFDNLLLKRLREQFGVPRLSLFYL